MRHGTQLSSSIITSTITSLEVLIGPIRKNNLGLISEYRELLCNVEGLDTLDVNSDIAEEAAKLRATYNTRIADSIQVATTTYKKAQFFLTNDIDLPTIPGLNMFVLDKLQSDL